MDFPATHIAFTKTECTECAHMRPAGFRCQDELAFKAAALVPEEVQADVTRLGGLFSLGLSCFEGPPLFFGGCKGKPNEQQSFWGCAKVIADIGK